MRIIDHGVRAKSYKHLREIIKESVNSNNIKVVYCHPLGERFYGEIELQKNLSGTDRMTFLQWLEEIGKEKGSCINDVEKEFIIKKLSGDYKVSEGTVWAEIARNNQSEIANDYEEIASLTGKATEYQYCKDNMGSSRKMFATDMVILLDSEYLPQKCIEFTKRVCKDGGSELVLDYSSPRAQGFENEKIFDQEDKQIVGIASRPFKSKNINGELSDVVLAITQTVKGEVCNVIIENWQFRVYMEFILGLNKYGYNAKDGAIVQRNKIIDRYFKFLKYRFGGGISLMEDACKGFDINYKQMVEFSSTDPTRVYSRDLSRVVSKCIGSEHEESAFKLSGLAITSIEKASKEFIKLAKEHYTGFELKEFEYFFELVESQNLSPHEQVALYHDICDFQIESRHRVNLIGLKEAMVNRSELSGDVVLVDIEDGLSSIHPEEIVLNCKDGMKINYNSGRLQNAAA